MKDMVSLVKYIYTFRWIIVSFLCLLLFVVLSKYEDRAGMRNLDFAVTVKIQEKIDNSSMLRTKVVIDNLMEGSSYLASPMISVALVLLLAWLSKKNRLLIPVLFALLVGAEIVGKSLVHHPSPPFSMIKHTTSVFPADYINEQYSYPSGHAARSLFIAILIYIIVKKKLFIVPVLLFYVGLVSISRIYLGHHWFSDVLGGLLLGGGFGLIMVSTLLNYRTQS